MVIHGQTAVEGRTRCKLRVRRYAKKAPIDTTADRRFVDCPKCLEAIEASERFQTPHPEHHTNAAA